MICKLAKENICIIDDYIDIKTLQLLKSSTPNILITIVTDNKGDNGLNSNFIKDSKLNIIFRKNNKKFHDRYIILDFASNKEIIYHCGSSSKDSGSRFTEIIKVEDMEIYHPHIEIVLKNPELIIKWFFKTNHLTKTLFYSKINWLRKKY